MKALLFLFLFISQFMVVAREDSKKPVHFLANADAVEQSVLEHAEKMSIFCGYFKHAEECSIPNKIEIEKYKSGVQAGKYRAYHNAILKSADNFARNIMPVDFSELKEHQLKIYYDTMQILDQLSRSQNQKIVDAVAHLALRLQNEWMGFFGDIFYRWIAYERNVSVSMGPLTGYLAGAYVINLSELSAKQTSGLFRYIRFKMPVKLFSYSLPIVAAKWVFDSLKESRPIILNKVPPSPAHLVRFVFSNRSLWNEFSDVETESQLLEYETKNKIIKDSVIAASILATSSSSGNWALAAAANGKRAISFLKVIRVTPMSFAIGISLERGLSWGLHKYQEWELADQLEESLKILLEDRYLDGDIRNKKRTDVAFKLSQLEVFNLQKYYSRMNLLKNIIELISEGQSDPEFIQSLMLEILRLSKQELKNSGFLKMKYDVCSDASLGVIIKSKHSLRLTTKKINALIDEVLEETRQVLSVIADISERWANQFKVNDPRVFRLLKKRPEVLARDIDELLHLKEILLQITRSKLLENNFENHLAPMIRSKDLLYVVDCQGYIKPLVSLDK